MLTKWFGESLKATREQLILSKDPGSASSIQYLDPNGIYRFFNCRPNPFAGTPAWALRTAEQRGSDNPRKLWIWIGSGGSAPSATDYKLESHINDGTLTMASNTTVYDQDNNPGKKFVLTFTNNTPNAITIREVGCYTNYTYSSYSAYWSDSANYLLDRTLLDTPVTVNPDESATIVYTLYFVMD
jgi:hypothetical protein